LDEAEAVIRRARKERKTIPEIHLITYFIAFLRGDEKAMEQAARERPHETEDQGWFLYQEASMLAHGGRLRDARALNSQSISMAEQSRLRERSALFRGRLAVWEALAGNRAQAKQDALVALKAFRGRDCDYGPAFALALAGESERALAVARELRNQFPEDTPVQFKYAPAIEAMAALQRAAPLEAVDLTLRAAPYDLAQTGASLFAYYGTMDPVYVRGLAYAHAGQHAAAAAEFQKIVDHPGVMLTDPVGALARLQLARAQNSMGEKAKVKASYGQFLELWKNADSDLPVLMEAKAELASLERPAP
jgi:tetratricopeptide (TPR) repeat protein